MENSNCTSQEILKRIKRLVSFLVYLLMGLQYKESPGILFCALNYQATNSCEETHYHISKSHSEHHCNYAFCVLT